MPKHSPHTMRRPLVAALLTFAFLLAGLAMPTPASAHYVYEDRHHYIGGVEGFPVQLTKSYKLRIRAEVSHGNGNGYFTAAADVCVSYPHSGAPLNPCQTVAADLSLLFQTYKHGKSGVCGQTAWHSNNGLRVSIQNTRKSLQCGTGWYGTVAWAHYKNPATGKYEMKSQWSGWHWLPT